MEEVFSLFSPHTLISARQSQDIYDKHSSYSLTISFYIRYTDSLHIAGKDPLSASPYVQFLFSIELNKTFVLPLDFVPPVPSFCLPGTRTASHFPNQPEGADTRAIIVIGAFKGTI